LALKANVVLSVRVARKESEVSPVRLASAGIEVRRVRLVILVSLVRLVKKASRDRLVSQDSAVYKVIVANKDFQV